MFRMQLSAGFVLIDGLLSMGLSIDGKSVAVLGMMHGVLSVTLGLLLAYRSTRSEPQE